MLPEKAGDWHISCSYTIIAQEEEPSAMVNKMILHELKSILTQRREVTKEQRAYARAEEELMSEMYPITRPSEEKRPPNCRTLERYIGYQAIETMRKYHGMSLSCD